MKFMPNVKCRGYMCVVYISLLLHMLRRNTHTHTCAVAHFNLATLHCWCIIIYTWKQKSTKANLYLHVNQNLAMMVLRFTLKGWPQASRILWEVTTFGICFLWPCHFEAPASFLGFETLGVVIYVCLQAMPNCPTPCRGVFTGDCGGGGCCGSGLGDPDISRGLLWTELLPLPRDVAIPTGSFDTVLTCLSRSTQ